MTLQTEMSAVNSPQVVETRDNMPAHMRHPLLVKIAPDLTTEDKEDIAAVLTRKQVSILRMCCCEGLLLNII